MASHVKLVLIIVSVFALIFLGRHHGQRFRTASAGDPFPPSITGRADPIDGDSLWVGDDEVRLKGIDAPEWKQDCRRDGLSWRCGMAARETLVGLIGSNDVTCAISERDVYGRMLGRCTAGDRNLNAEMVASGMAVAYGSYWNEQGKARAARKGLWSGEFEEPRAWRAQRASEDER
ncbi:MAG: thermonuclease family protein [Hyphomicrobium sp.]|uniref:thermonuclease family protein n=1 Tax=Hyphomicrobium sp. TaxID=82 RepID=UPI0039E4B3ED